VKRKLNVMVVDDNRADARLMKEHVEMAGACCVYQTFSSVDDGLTFLENVKKENYMKMPDLIFIDINMPKRNGFEFIEEMKKDKYLKNIPTIIFSSSDDPLEVIKAYSLGVNCFIQKPIDSEEFGKLIDRTWAFWTLCVTNPSNPPAGLGLS
jgi:two-component system, chemotaxis family, response regulator Rcp1